MRPGVEDHLLRELVRTEVNRSADAGLTAATYERLVDALRKRQPLSGVLGQDAQRAGRAEDDVMIARLRLLGSEPSYFSRSPHALEDLHEVATLVDFLLEVDAIESRDAEAFFMRRADVAGRRANANSEADLVGAMDDLLDALLASRSIEEGETLVDGLGHLDVLSEQRFLRARDQLDARRRDEPLPELRNVGAARETVLGPPGRYCGVRVLAVELCEHGVVVHVHRAMNAADDRQQHESLPDELAAATSGWPLTPTLRLRDSAGTAYRGSLSGVHFGDVEIIDEGDGYESVDEVTFAPAVPDDAAHLWLASEDESIRIDLR
jgi:hypothetical protein